jgi:hypothetical protein
LTIAIPTKQQACNFQFDAVIGPPLQNVGPNGSYYSPRRPAWRSTPSRCPRTAWPTGRIRWPRTRRLSTG